MIVYYAPRRGNRHITLGIAMYNRHPGQCALQWQKHNCVSYFSNITLFFQHILLKNTRMSSHVLNVSEPNSMTVPMKSFGGRQEMK